MSADDVSRDERASSAEGVRSNPPAAKVEETPRELVDRHPLAKGIAVGVAVSVAIAFLVLQNRSETELEWLWMDFSAPLWLALLGAFLAGLVAGPLLGVGIRRGLRRRRQRKTTLDQLTRTQ